MPPQSMAAQRSTVTGALLSELPATALHVWSHTGNSGTSRRADSAELKRRPNQAMRSQWLATGLSLGAALAE